MPQKYIALTLIALGIVAIIGAYKMDAHSSFEGGTFIVEIGFAVIGIVAIVVGLIWLAVIAFLGL